MDFRHGDFLRCASFLKSATCQKSLSRFYECDIVRTDILRAKTDMGPISRPLEIGILIYPEAQLAAVHGSTDNFLVANRFAAVRRLPAEPALRGARLRTERRWNASSTLSLGPITVLPSLSYHRVLANRYPA